MRPSPASSLLSLLALLTVGLTASAQTTVPFEQKLTDTTDLALPPRTLREAWLLVERDLRFGLESAAQRDLEALLNRSDLTPENLLQVREELGSSLLVKLQLHPSLRPQARKLIDMANEASLARARDPERIRGFINQLGRSPGERAYAMEQLRISGVHAIPYFVEALREPRPDQREVRNGLFDMPISSWPAVAAILESGVEPLMQTAIEALANYGVRQSADSLWHVVGNQSYSLEVRRQAAELVARLTGARAADLQAPWVALTNIANRHYRQAGDLAASAQTVDIWSWAGDTVKQATHPLSDASSLLGAKAARQAIELNANYSPAQSALLSILIDSAVRKAGPDQPLPADALGAHETALAAGPEPLVEVLRRALHEKRTTVILGAIQSLGETADSTQLIGRTTEPGLLGAAIDYPDERVQFAAAIATLELHPERCSYAQRVIDTLVSALGSDSKPTAVVINSDLRRGNLIGQLFNQSGYQAQVYQDGRSAFEFAAVSGGDLIAVEPAIQRWGLLETIANFRADARTQSASILVFSRNEPEQERLETLLSQYPRVLVAPMIATTADLAAVLHAELADPQAAPLTAEERVQNRKLAALWCVRLARGELPVFDVARASEALAGLLDDQELGPQAAQALGYLPAAQVQRYLSSAALTETSPMPVRVAALEALARNVQLGGPALDRQTTTDLVTLFQETQDPQLRPALARAVGSLGPEGALVAQRVLAGRLPTSEPAVAAPAASPPKPVAEPEPVTPPETKAAPKPAPKSAKAAPTPPEPKPAVEPATPQKRPSFFDM